MKLLVLGASGLVGRTLLPALKEDYDSEGTYCTPKEEYREDRTMHHLDIANQEEFRTILETLEPRIIVSCLGGKFEEQLRLHEQAAQFLKEVPKGKMIYLSTANVFDKLDSAPHYEGDETGAVSDYGNFKIQCEGLMKGILGDMAAILRLPFIWGKTCPRLTDIREKLKQGKAVEAWEDLYTNHTTDLQITDTIKEIIKKDLNGIFHIGTEEVAEHTEFIKKLLKAMGAEEPELSIKKMPYKTYMAMLASRDDMAVKTQKTVDELIQYIVG